VPLSGQRQGTRWRSDGEIGETYCGPSVPNSTSSSAEMHLSGNNVIHRGILILRATGLPAFTFGIFLVSQSRAFATGIPGSQGNLCLGGGIGRFVGPGQLPQADALGEISLVVDQGALPSPQGAFAPAHGQSLYF
jgi:hypothetical protein